MIDTITTHMTALIKGGMEANIETLHYAVAMANADVQGIGMEILTDERHDGAIRNHIAAEVHSELQAVAA